VRGHPERLPAQRLEVLLGLLAGLFLAARDDDSGSGGHEALGEGTPDAARAARHDHHATGEVEELPEPLAVHAPLVCELNSHYHEAARPGKRR
jgi:hypothetical protein